MRRSAEKIVARWHNMCMTWGWLKWNDYVGCVADLQTLQQNICNRFSRIENGVFRSFASRMLQQWHVFCSHQRHLILTLLHFSFTAWHTHTRLCRKLTDITLGVAVSRRAERLESAYGAFLWGAVAFKSCQRHSVCTAFQRQQSSRTKNVFMHKWLSSVYKTSEHTSQSIEYQHRASIKSQAHFFNEWRVTAVRQQDLRNAASTIAQQWERELLLKKKVPLSFSLSCVIMFCHHVWYAVLDI